MYQTIVAGLAACLLVFAAPAAASKALVVGVLPYQGARALIAEHRDLAAHLRGALKRPVHIVTARNTRVFGQRLLAGDYDLALVPAHFARLAQRDAGGHLLAAHHPDTPVYLMALASAPAKSAPQAGDTLAVPDRGMLITLATQNWLDSHAALTSRDYRLLEAGSHSAALQALLDGQADYAVTALAALAQIRPGQLDRLRIAHDIGTVPLLIYVARHDLPPATRTQLKAALLKFPVPAPLRMVASDERKLAAMDRYLPATRLLLTEREESAHVR